MKQILKMAKKELIMNFKLSENEITIRVKGLAQEIYNFYKNRNINEIHLIFITTSSFIFASDLIRDMSGFDIKIHSDHLSIRSYSGNKSSKIIVNEEDLERLDLDKKVVLIVDDILDTGTTLNFLNERINERYKPLMIDFCCLLKKEDIKRKMDIKIKFIGFKIPNVFVVGYGLDYNGLYRELPFIKELKTP